MRISFDIDDTLVCKDPAVPREPARVPWPLRIWLDEPLRAGAPALMRSLARRGWELWVYTSSFRSPLGLKLWLAFYGVRVGGVINQSIHEKYRGAGSRPSKHPPSFGIDLHIDDQPGVALEGERHRFAVVLVEPSDRSWTEKVLEAARRLEGEDKG